MKLGAVAELKVRDYKVLNDALLHRIPMEIVKARLDADLQTMKKGDYDNITDC